MLYRIVKRVFDFICALIGIVGTSPLWIIGVVGILLSDWGPVFYVATRIGKNNEPFKMYKFRTMTDKKDAEGNLLPDEVRLTKFGAWLRSTSLDELPEAFCILNGTMTLIGPRPQLVRDMVFMSEEQRMRHTAKPGLSGLAQISGRNAISWDRKLQYDLEYIEHVSFRRDLKILFKTVEKAFIKQEGITEEGSVTAADYGDYLLQTKQISKEEYDKKQNEAKELLKGLK